MHVCVSVRKDVEGFPFVQRSLTGILQTESIPSTRFTCLAVLKNVNYLPTFKNQEMSH